MRVIGGGVTAATGFLFASTTTEIKYKNRRDMAMIYSEMPYKAAETSTANIVKTAPVKWDQNVVENSPFVQAVIINAGIANTCTRAEEYRYCGGTANVAAEVLKIPADTMLVASTKVIGMQLPIDRITAGVKAMVPKLDGGTESGAGATQTIMTTDARKKEAAVQVELGGKTVTIGGMYKDSDMTHPDMCTMPAFVTTDAAISKGLLQGALSEGIQDTYNMMSMDNDTSTDDTVLLLADGMSGGPEITEKSKDYEAFKKALSYVDETLAEEMTGGGRGCTALFKATIVGVESKGQAKILTKSIITSSLTKATIFGHDANWGRILCAMGYSSTIFDPEKVNLFFQSTAGKVRIIENGVTVDYSEEQTTKILSEPEVTVIADVKMGGATASAWDCDLAFGCVKINTDYRL